jgi:LCP family protein required for cell wall assembly
MSAGSSTESWSQESTGNGAATSSRSSQNATRRSDRPSGSSRSLPTRGRHHGPVRRRRSPVAVVSGLLVGVLLIGGSLVALGYHRLSGNIRSVSLLAGAVDGPGSGAGREKPDPFGHTPINVLVIGSDTRNNPADSRLGGGSGGGANADVELVVHISADRTNATVMSVPRDTVTQLPRCKNPATGHTMNAGIGQINSTLAYGPGCTVAAVHLLTGIPIDHFAMVDFAGVVSMSDAVGGVAVCVNKNVYDPYSHLKLSRGTHTLQGVAALEFVRSRHAFGDGSDLGRTYAQHIFLSSMIRRLKSTGVVTNPGALLSLANAATKALTVDTGLASIPTLLGLAADVDKVPANRITFTTMQTMPDPNNTNRVVPAPSAQGLFAAIIDDQPVTAAGTSGVSAASLAAVRVRVENGTGIQGRAALVAQTLMKRGFRSTTSGTGTASATSSVHYVRAAQAQARALAKALGLPGTALAPVPTGAQAQDREITVVIGADWTAGSTFKATGTAVGSGAVLDTAHAQTANQSASCAPVSTFKTVVVNGVPMNPTRAYAVSTNVARSAP